MGPVDLLFSLLHTQCVGSLGSREGSLGQTSYCLCRTDLWYHDYSPHGSCNESHQQCMRLISGLGMSLAARPILAIGVANPPGLIYMSSLAPPLDSRIGLERQVRVT